MTRRVPLDDEQECGFWRTGARAEVNAASCRVLIGHVDQAIGASLALLVALRKYEVVHVAELSTLRCCFQSWRPHALLLDTRLDAESHYAFVRTVRHSDQTGKLQFLP